MRKMKRLFAVILSLAMVLGMSLTALAANPVNITVNLPEGAEEAKLTYVRIVKPDVTSKNGWAFDNGYSEEKLGMTIDELLTAGSIETEGNKNNDNKNAEAGTINTTAKLGKALDSVEMNNLAEVPGSGLSRKLSAGEAGLYVIEAKLSGWTFTRMLAYVAYEEGQQTLRTDTTVTAKGAKDGVDKELNDPIYDEDGETPVGDKGFSVATQDTVKYKVTQNYPYYDADQTVKKFIITDTLTRGEFPENVLDTLEVKIVDKSGVVAELNKNIDYTLERVSDNQIKLDLGNDFYKATYAGKQVEITYDVLVTEVTWQFPLENSVESITTKDYPEGTADFEIEDNVSRFKIISPSVKADIQKLGEEGKKLAGAEFTIYVKAEGDPTHVLKEDKTIVALKENETPGEKEVGLTQVGVVETVGDEGIATFDSLDAQKEYYVVETKAPEGYSLNTEAYKLVMPAITETVSKDETIDGVKYNTVTRYIVDSSKVKIEGRDEGDRTVTDTKLSSLPSTGGIGTTIFTIGGCAIMIIAAALFFASRRKSSAK